LAPLENISLTNLESFAYRQQFQTCPSIAQVRFIPRQKGFPMEQHASVARGSDIWWPEKLGQPVTCGSQYGRRYAFFRELRRLIVESYGKLTVYHTGDLQISGICPNSSRAMSLTFYSQEGLVDIDELRQIS
jgi:hypothetical protein